MQTKVCTGCNQEKSILEFHTCLNSPSGYRARCKVCTHADNNNRARVRKYKRKKQYFWTRELHHQHKMKSTLTPIERRKNTALLSRYGITLAEYNNLLQKQNGVCAICGRKPGRRSLHVDHCHKTGKVRALLCTHCNTTIGHVAENINILHGVIKYLENHQWA